MGEENNNAQDQQQKQPNASQAIDAAQGGLEQARALRKRISAKKTADTVKTASKTARLSNIAAKLIILLKYVVFFLIVVIILIGLITFVITGMGLIWSGISDIMENVVDWWKSITDGEETIVKYDTIQDTMNYLYSMDYDLYGYGFVTRPDTSIDSGSGWTIKNNDADENEEEEPQKSEEENPNNESNENNVGQGHIKVDEDAYKKLSKGDPKSNPYTYLQVYAISDNYSNLIKNNNHNFSKIFSGDGLKAINFIKKLVVGGDLTNWGSGLLSVYYEKLDENSNPIIGMRGADINGVTEDNAEGQDANYYNAANVKVSNGKLVVSSGAANNIKFRYSLDGWVGRYGMPLEFLLSVHLATMAPDLSYKLATSFDTDVEILLRKSNDSSVVAGVVQKNKEKITSTLNLKTSEDLDDMTEEEKKKAEIIITEEDINNALTDPQFGKYSDVQLREMKKNGEDVFFNLNKSDVIEIFRHTNLVSPDSCMGPGSERTISESTYVPVYMSNLEEDLSSVNRNEVASKEHNNALNKISDVRQEIEALIFKYINDALVANDDNGELLINAENGVKEVNMEAYELKEVVSSEYNQQQSGEILGRANNHYSISQLPTSDSNGNAVDYYSDTPMVKTGNNNGGNHVYDGELAEESLQNYIHEKIWNEIGSDDLVKMQNLSFVDGNKKEVIADKPYRGNAALNLDHYFKNEYERLRNASGGPPYNIFYVNTHDRNDSNTRTYDLMQLCLINLIWSEDDDDVKDYISRYIRTDKKNVVSIEFASSNASCIGNRIYRMGRVYDQDNWTDASAIVWTQRDINNTYSSDERAHKLERLYGKVDARNLEDYMVIDDYLADELYKKLEPKQNEDFNDNFNLTRPWDAHEYHLLKKYSDEKTDSVHLYKNYNESEQVDENKIQKLFRYIESEDYARIVRTSAIELLDGNNNRANYFADVEGAKFDKYTDVYADKNIIGHAYKPILKNNNSAWNFSFINFSKNPDENGQNGFHTFITISISTKSPNDSDAKTAKLEEKDGKYTIQYLSQEIGQVKVDFTITKVSDETLKTGIGEGSRCSDKVEEGVCCDICYNYVKELYKTLRSMTELKMTTYVPYVNRVADHWYRNVYFTPNAIKDYNDNFVSKYNSNLSDNEEDMKIKKEANIVQVDEEYAISTGERWTKYEMYTDDDGTQRYKLYVYKEDENGNFKLGNDWVKVVEENDGNYNLIEEQNTYKFVGEKKGKYNLIKEDGSLYVDHQDEIRLGKKATDLTTVSDILAGPTDEKPNIWTGAYSDIGTKVKTGWQILDPNNEDLEEMDSEMKKILTEYQDITIVSSQEYESVEQVEDGIRGETKSKIKKIFLDDYYIYDGTTERASIIQNFKFQHGNDPDDVPAGETHVNSYGKEVHAATVKDVSGKINITKDSLNAFAILKNMKTLDAEYIYHDFKELIVELNYFDKEDLRENVQQVMMFPIAGINSKNWPVGGIDKFPTYYGTLIHSKADYEYLLNEQEVKQKLHEIDLENTSGENSKPKIERTGEGSDKKFHKDTFYETAQACWEYIVTAKNYTYNETQGNVPATNNANMNDRLFVSWVLYEYGYEDCIGAPKDYGFFNTSNRPKEDYGFIVKSYGDNEDFRDELNKGDIVSFSTSQGTSGGHVAIIASITEDEDNEKIIKAYDCSKAINWTLSNRVSGVDITNLVKAGGARVIRVDQNPVLNYDYGFEGGEPVVAPASGLVIDYGTTKRTNKETGKEDEVGYIKIKLLDDTDTSFVEKQKIPNGEGDSASVFLSSNYSKEDLKVLGYDYFEEEYKDAGIAGNILYIEGFDISEVLEKGENSGGDDSDSDFKYTVGDYTDPITNKVYHNVTFDENGNVVRGGGGGNYIIADNLIKTQTVNASTKNTVKATGENSATITSKEEHKNNIELLKNYVEKYASNRYSTQYQIQNLQDKKAQFNLKVKEEAKKQADYSVKVGNRIYIKEGAIIGYTYPEDNEFSENRDLREVKDDGTIETNEGAGSVGNYLRVILRDLDDEVVENVEEYMELADNKPKFKITEQFMYWMAFTSEGALVPADGNTDYYLSEDIGDGVGNSGPFGLTYYCGDTAASIGYKDFVKHQGEGKVPLTEGDDVFAAVLEAERQEVYDALKGDDEDNSNKNNIDLLKRTSDYMFLALVDLSHAGPVMLNQQIDKFRTQGYLTRKDFQDNWGTAEAFAGGLKGRAVRRGILALDELYTAGNLESGFYEVIWLSNQPWSDYLKKHDNNGSIFGGSAIRLVTYTPNSEQFDLSKKNSN